MLEGVPASDRAAVQRRAARLSTLLAADAPDTATVRASADAMRSAVLGASVQPAAPLRSARSRGWLRAAAVLLAIAATFALVPPLRAWVADGVLAAARALGVEPAAHDAATADAAAASSAASPAAADVVRLSFPLRAPILEITLDLADGAGITIVTASAAGDAVEASGAYDLSYLLVPGGMRIGSGPGERELKLLLPASVREVHVGGEGVSPIVIAVQRSAQVRTRVARDR